MGEDKTSNNSLKPNLYDTLDDSAYENDNFEYSFCIA